MATLAVPSATRRRPEVEPLGCRRVLPLAGDLFFAPVGKCKCWVEARFVFDNDWVRQTDLG